MDEQGMPAGRLEPSAGFCDWSASVAAGAVALVPCPACAGSGVVVLPVGALGAGEERAGPG